jgi:hypothetical protein
LIQIPEPTTAALLITGITAFLGVRRRHWRHSCCVSKTDDL